MRGLAYNEPIQHQTGGMPLAYYYVDENHPRYHMRVHWHRETELIRVRCGALCLYLDEQPIQALAGDLVLVGEGALHGGEAEGGVYECIVFDPYRLLMSVEACKEEVLPLIGRSMHIVAREMTGALREAIERLYDTLRESRSPSALAVTGAMFAAMHELAKSGRSLSLNGAPQTGARIDQLKPALEYIETHYENHISLEQLARQSGLSPKYFCRCFRAVTHRSPIEYLNHYRIECASFLLTTTDLTVAEIAQKCGFVDSSFFIKQFRKYKRTTPRRYRVREPAPQGA